MACSSDSKEQLCQHVDTQCNPINICKTCTRDLLTGTGICHQVRAASVSLLICFDWRLMFMITIAMMYDVLGTTISTSRRCVLVLQ